MKKIRTKIIVAYLLLAVTVIVGSDVMVSWRIGAFLQQRIIADLDRQSHVLSSDSSGRVIADSDISYEETARIKNHLDRPEAT